jgi:hypothetical protein
MDLENKSELAQLLHNAPIIIITTLLNVLVSMVMGLFVLLDIYLPKDGGHEITLSHKVVVVLITIATYAYLVLLPKIRNYINYGS